MKPLRPRARRRVLLELDLTRRVLEAPPSSPIETIRVAHAPTLRAVVEALDKASRDDHVAGLVAHMGSRQPTLAQSNELRAAVKAFGDAGKPTVCWSESYGEELGPGNVSYHLASAFQQVWLQPSGGLGLLGVSAEAVFVRDTLDKVGVQPQIGQRHEYKTAANTLLESGMTPAHREMLGRLVESATEVIVDDVAAGRRLDPSAVRDAIDAAPLSAEQALQRGLVDRIGYRDEVYAELRNGLGDIDLRFVERYGKGPFTLGWRTPSLLTRDKPVIAIVHASGPIHLGRSRHPSPLSGRTVGSDTVGATLRAAARDDAIKAVVLRVDSPGGSYVASDAIRHQVHALRAAGRPVVASMADVAASGGYYIAMPADVVLASPGTLTGSIGVLAGKQVIRQALERLGVQREPVTFAAHADMFSSHRPFDEQEWRRLDDWLDRVYDDFTTKAAQDRGMPVDRIREVAKGRVWSGADAVPLGLVDQLGGLSDAIDVACARAGVHRNDVRVRAIPEVSPIDRLRPATNSNSPAAAVRGGGLLDAGAGLSGEGLLEAALAAAGLPRGGALRMPVSVRLR